MTFCVIGIQYLIVNGLTAEFMLEMICLQSLAIITCDMRDEQKIDGHYQGVNKKEPERHFVVLILPCV